MAQPGPDRLGPAPRVRAGHHGHAQPEPVQQLRAQLAFFRVHRPDEQELAGVPQRDALPLDRRDPGRGGVQQHVDQVVGQQVDLVDVQDAAVGHGQQARHERLGGGRPGQHPGHVQAPGDPVVGRAERQFHQPGGPVPGGGAGRVRAVGAGRVRRGRVAGEPAPGDDRDAGQDVGQAAYQRRLGGALLAGQQNAADARVHGAQQQGQPGLVLPDDRRERQPARPGRARPGGRGRRAVLAAEAVRCGAGQPGVAHSVPASSCPSTSR